MNRWQKIRLSISRIKDLLNQREFKDWVRSPTGRIICINTGVFALWRLKGVSQSFLVKHLSFDRFNIKEHRYYTLVTHAFSHFGFISFLFNMMIVGFFGKIIVRNYGNRVLWSLYMLGALFGGLAMNFGMPYMPIVIPQVGADSSTSAILTFFGLLNAHSQANIFFFFPVKMWVLLAFMLSYSLLFDPSRKNLGGMMAGLLVYQLFRFRII